MRLASEQLVDHARQRKTLITEVGGMAHGTQATMSPVQMEYESRSATRARNLCLTHVETVPASCQIRSTP